MNPKLKILFVEDVDSDFELIKRAIRKSEIEFVDQLVETSEDYKDALVSFKPDIILSDYALPQFDGMQALKIRQTEAPTTPFILVTGALNEETAVKVMKAGADDYIIKHNLTRIGSAITSAVDKWESIVAKKQAEISLRESEELLRITLSNITDPLFITDDKGKFFFICPNVENSLGFTMDEIKKMGNISKLLGNDLFNHEDLKNQGVIENLERSIVDNSGTDRFFLINVKQVSIEWGTVLYTFHEITERKQALEALKKSEDLLKRTNEIAKIGGWEVDLISMKPYMTRQTFQIYELDPTGPAPSVEKGIQFYAPEARPIIQAAVQDAIEHGTPYDLELPFITAKGKHIWIRTVGNALMENGKTTKLAGTFQDITELRLAENALKASEKKFRELANLLPQVVYEIDTEGNLKYLNDLGFELFGFPKKGLNNVINVLQRIAPEDKARAKKNIQLVLSGKKDDGNPEYTAIKKDGSRFPILIYASVIIKESEIKGLRGVIVDITERKKAEEDLIASELQYRRFFEKNISGVYLSTPQGKMLDCNPAFAKMLSYSIAEVLELNTESLYPHPTDRSEFLRKLSVNKSLVGAEIDLVRKDGQVINCIENVVGIFNLEGKLEQFQGYIVDITKRKKAEEKIKKLSQAVEQSPASIIITGLNGNIEYTNPKFSEVTGYLPEEVYGENPRILKSGHLPSEKYKELWETISSGHEWRGEFHNRKKDGELFWEYASISPIRNNEGKTTHYLAVKEDITERKEAVEKLRRSEEKYRKLIETTSEGFWLIDNEAITIDVNHSLCEMIGHSKEQMIGSSPFDYVDRENSEIFKQQILESKTLKNRKYDISLRKSDGESFPAIFNATSLYDDTDKKIGSFAFITDITERKRAEELIRRSENQLRELTLYMDAKFEEERKRIGKEIHDGLGQLLTGLIMDLQWIEKKWPEESALVKNKFSAMKNTIAVSVKEVQNLSIQLRPEMLDNLGLLETMKAEIEKFDERTGIYCDLKFVPDSFEVEFERRLTIYRVLMELLTNVYRYADATRVDIRLEKKKDYLLFNFSDNGIGIKQEEIDDTSSFGLMTISERVKRWKGTVEISGEHNKGTSVTITIPI